MKKYVYGILTVLLLFAYVLPIQTAAAASEEDIEEAIVAGLIWLASEQNTDGSWHRGTDDYDRAGVTAFVVLKMEDRAIELGFDDPFDPEYEYSDEVALGLDFIFSSAHPIDTDGDTVDDAVYFADTGGYWWYHHFVYETSVAVMAIAASNTPDRIVDVASSPVDGWTYQAVLEDTVEYLLYAQRNNDLVDDGGWGYGAPGQTYFTDRSDNSNTGWAVLALIYAQNRFSITIPETVKENLNDWIDYIQHDSSGGSGYDYPNTWVNLLKTGNLLFEMAFVGDDAETARAQAAIGYIETHWNDANQDPGWKGPLWGVDTPHYQAMYTMMKGFEAMGIETITVGADEVDWFDEFSSAIVNTQNPDDSWPRDYWGQPALTTAWALLTLERVVEIPTIQVFVDIKPQSWPNPINTESKGVIPLAICGMEDFDVTTIDPASILLTIEDIEDGVAPLRWSLEDVATPYDGDEGGGHEEGPDGYLDLVLHFDAQEVVTALSLVDFQGSSVALIVIGNLLEEEGGTPIQGHDYVWVLNVKKNGPKT